MSSQLLAEAIEKRVVISFRHEGQQHSVEPYSLGYDQRLPASMGPLVLRAWCLAREVWRDFAVKHMSGIELSDERFAGDRPGHARMSWVISDIWGQPDRWQGPDECLHDW